MLLSFDAERLQIQALHSDVCKADGDSVFCETNEGGHPGQSQEAEGSSVSAMIRLRAARP
jgi:hypothetical protein